MGRAVSPLDLALIVSNVYLFLLISRIILRRDKAAQAQQLNYKCFNMSYLCLLSEPKLQLPSPHP